jgi:transposase InsO family protein
MTKPYIKDSDEYYAVKTFLQHNTINGMNRLQKLRFKKKCEQFELHNDKLYFVEEGKRLEVIQLSEQSLYADRLKQFHEEHCHIRGDKFYAKVCSIYFGFERRIIRETVERCAACQQALPLKRTDPIRVIVSRQTFERIQLDVVDMKDYKDNNDEYKFILSAVDSCSKFGWCFMLKTKSASEVSKCFRSIIRGYGAPQILHTDNGKEFVNKDFDEICDRYKIRHVRGRPRHPQTQGQVERFNQTITRKLQTCMFESKSFRWIDILDDVVFAYNTSLHTATKQTPFEAMFGRRGENVRIDSTHEAVEDTECDSPQLKREDIDEIAQRAEPEFSKYHKRMIRNSSVHTPKSKITVGIKVLLKADFDNNSKTKKRKLGSFYDGEYEVIELLSNDRALIQSGDEKKTISIHRLKILK